MELSSVLTPNRSCCYDPNFTPFISSFLIHFPIQLPMSPSSQTFVALLRGINVSGKNKIFMDDLRAMFESLGLTEVKTYVQSGNVIFSGGSSAHELEGIIKKAILEKFTFDVPVLVKTKEEMQATLRNNLYIHRNNVSLDKLHVTFLSEVPSEANLKNAHINVLPDEFMVLGKEVYLYIPGGYGNTKLSNTYFESKLKVRATTRNWKTVNELVKMLS